MNKIGLVLEGGGAKGAFHCGAIKALCDYGYKFDGAVGTSIGAINAALYVQDGGYQTMMSLWNHVTPSMLTDFDDEKVEELFNNKFDKDNITYWLKQFYNTAKNLGISTDKSLDLLKRYISEPLVRKSNIEYGLVTYSLSDMESKELYLEDIPKGSLHNYILASAYYPAFKFERLEGKFFFDGGLRNNMPINLLISKGYDHIIAIRTMSKRPFILPEGTEAKIDFICPSEDLGGAMQVTKRMIARNIKLGYYDVLRYIKGYTGKRYYISGSIEELILELIGSRWCGINREQLTSALSDIYEGVDTEEALITYLEEFATLCNMEKFTVYKPKQFVEKLRNKSFSLDFQENVIYKLILREKIKKEELFTQLMRKES